MAKENLFAKNQAAIAPSVASQVAKYGTTGRPGSIKGDLLAEPKLSSPEIREIVKKCIYIP